MNGGGGAYVELFNNKLVGQNGSLSGCSAIVRYRYN